MTKRTSMEIGVCVLLATPICLSGWLTLSIMVLVLLCACSSPPQSLTASTNTTTAHHDRAYDQAQRPLPVCQPYDASVAPCLASFQPIKLNALCPFAKRARLWGGASVAGGTLEEHVAASVERFCEFARGSAQLGVDGFVFEDSASATLDSHAASTLRVLRALSALDPSGIGCLAEPGNVVGRTWSFRWRSRDPISLHLAHTFSIASTYPPLRQSGGTAATSS